MFDDEARAFDAGDTQRMRLGELRLAAERDRYLHPERSLARYREGQVLAEQLDDPWWAMFFRHGQLQVLLYGIRDLDAALPLAVECAVEVRKPRYANLPQRVCIHEDLVGAYAAIDPLGYAGRIDAALAYMEREAAPHLECYGCWCGLRADLAAERGDLDATQAFGRQLLTWSEQRDHAQRLFYRVRGIGLICRALERQAAWLAVQHWSAIGEVTATEAGDGLCAAEFQLLLALAMLQLGNADEARRLNGRAVRRRARFKTEPTADVYDTMAAFQELDGAIERALNVRKRQLAGLQDKGNIWVETRCRIEVCRLRAALGKPITNELAAARRVASRLHDPSPSLRKLDDLGGTLADRRQVGGPGAGA